MIKRFKNIVFALHWLSRFFSYFRFTMKQIYLKASYLHCEFIGKEIRKGYADQNILQNLFQLFHFFQNRFLLSTSIVKLQ